MAQQNGIEKPDLHALPTISDRMTFIYLEHCKVSRENGAVTATDLDGTVYIPAAAITVLLLGPGTLFPAYAGVIQLGQECVVGLFPFPRIRGGDPYPNRNSVYVRNFSPLCSLEVLFFKLFPAYAGLHNSQKKRCFQSTAFFKIYS